GTLGCYVKEDISALAYGFNRAWPRRENAL
ncbi:unnamed protein product, partial [marine sediment metagenome]